MRHKVATMQTWPKDLIAPMGSRSLSPVTHALAIALLIPTLAACTGDSTPRSSSARVVDSAGVISVRLGALEDVRAPDMALETIFSSGGEELPFVRINAGLILPDSGVVISDAGVDKLFLLRPDGELERTLGGTGSGPGEFRDITTLHAELDGFSAYDARAGRWTFFTNDGELKGTEGMSPGAPTVDLKPLAKTSRGEVLAVFGQTRQFSTEPVQRDTTPFLRFSSLDDSRPDTLGLWPGLEWAYSTEVGSFRFGVGFYRNLVARGRAGRILLADTDTLKLTVFNHAGEEVMRISGDRPPMATTAEEADAVRGAWVDAETPERLRRVILAGPYNDSYPAFHDAVIDAAHRVWVASSVRVGEPTRDWLLFGPDGGTAGRIRLPADAHVLDATGELVLLRTENALGVQSVELHRFSGPG